MVLDFLDHQLHQRLVQALKFGQLGFLTNAFDALEQGVDGRGVEFGRLTYQLRAQTGQGIYRFAHDFDNLLGVVLAVEGLVEQLLDLPAELADAIGPGHSSRPLQCMERAPNVGQQDLVGQLPAPLGET